MAPKQQSSVATLMGGVFEAIQHAATVVDRVLDAGLESSRLGMLMSDRTAERHFGPPNARNELGAAGTYSVHVNRLALNLKPMAALGTPGSGLVAAGPLAAALVSAGLGSSSGLEAALTELGLDQARAGDIARRVKNGAVVVAVQPGSSELASRLAPLLAHEGAVSFELPLEHPLVATAVVTRPQAPPGAQRARYDLVVEPDDDGSRAPLGARKPEE